uniref:BD-FAE-like domain-containing protein n=1 Tax=Globisporangium ultimum (strain ATCC 200006 / CBS 805.95 / DAOM BR144) TaxID=431595 RepID=K3X2G7_GLOUD
MTAPLVSAQERRSVQTRVLRFCMSVAGLVYLRKTWTALFQQRAMLQLQAQQQDMFWRTLKYTFSAQLIAASEYLLPLVKPLLAARIGKLLVWKGPQVVARNAVYGPHPRNTVDVYDANGKNPKAALTLAMNPKPGSEAIAPQDDMQVKKPVLVFVHGGAWSFGHKWQYGLVGEYLSSALGIVVAVVNYRTYPSGHVQDMVQDVEHAIRWIETTCHLYGGDKDQIFLSGHSSGAHVGALTLIQSALRVAGPTSDKNDLIKKNEVVRSVKGFIGLAGPYDISDHYVFESERVVGPLQGVHEISPMKPAVLGMENFKVHSPTAIMADVKHKNLKLPAFHILHGLDDAVVPSSSSEKFAASLKQARQRVNFIPIAGCTHEDIIFSVMGDPVTCRDRVVDHIRRILDSSVEEVAAKVAKKESKSAGASASIARAKL